MLDTACVFKVALTSILLFVSAAVWTASLLLLAILVTHDSLPSSVDLFSGDSFCSTFAGSLGSVVTSSLVGKVFTTKFNASTLTEATSHETALVLLEDAWETRTHNLYSYTQC